MIHKRYTVLDGLRGLALVNMIIYHAIWDLVYLFGFNWKWYQSDAAHIWQQAICWTFVLLSGFCLPLSKQRFKRGAEVFLAGAGVSVVTILLMPENQVLFGVLTLIGSCMLLLSLLNPLFKRCNATIGFLVSFILFLFTEHISQGYLGLGAWRLLELPREWYCNYITAYLGLPAKDFYSTDYFGLLPWLFLFTAGYFLYHLFSRRKLFPYLEKGRLKPLEWIGRHSLIIYILHQPLIYFLFTILL